MTSSEMVLLTVGHRARSAAVTALWVSVAGAAAFTVFAFLTTQVHAIRAGSPWQDDPYDGVVSFTQLIVPALAVLTVTRARLLRGCGCQPVFRVGQLLRAALVCTLLVAATVVTDWLAVTVRADHRLWNHGTPWLIAALAPLTAAVAAGLLTQWRAFRRLPPRDARGPEGDWLDDLPALTELVARALPRTGRRLAGVLGRDEVIGFTRRHVLPLAAAITLVTELPLSIGEALGEHWTDPLLSVTVNAIGSGGFFALIMICNKALRIVVPHADDRTLSGRLGRARRSARMAAVAGALALPTSAVLRGSIWPMLGGGGRLPVPVAFATITFTGAATTTLVVFGTVLILSRPTRPRRRPRRWRGWVRRTVKSIAATATALVVVSAGYVAAVATLHAQPVTLPAPAGPHHVGRTMFDWTDHTRADPLAPTPRNARNLSVWVWYPAVPGARGRRAPYAPGAWNQLHLPSLPGLGETDFAAVRTHALEDVPPAGGRFPVVVLLPGLGFAAPQYATLAENLASHGYLVAGVTPTYSANLTVLHAHPVHATTSGNPAFDGTDLHTAAATEAGDRLTGIWAADARFAAAQVARLGLTGRFAGRVDTARTAYVGHSFGGAAALEACRTDPHCAGAADLDGTQFGPVAHTGLNKPMMIIAAQDSCVTGTCRPADTADRSDVATAHAMLTAGTGPAWRYQIEGARHFNFTDYGAYYLAAPIRPLLALGTIDGDLGLQITNTYLSAFVDHALRGSPEPLLTGQTTPYPQIRIQPTIRSTPAVR
ncbi:alpha/beta hydrolase family protein [Actinoallomurus sp. CA-142502]|uniref:alpha/beta hydrolase family protein n=1 Tax=Actinoallomurus sp. CA-142502 TaxID=3239885 RepID=UPI003D913ABD